MDLNLNNPDQIKQLIAVLQNLLPKDNDAGEQDEEQNPNIKTKSCSSKSKKKVTKNKFLDMPERNMHKSDSKIDKLLNVQPPTVRTREFVPVDARCRVCGKTESVNPTMIPDSIERYKCNKCAGTAGG